MTFSIRHKFTNPKADGPDATVVRPSNWNDEHDVTGFGTAAALDIDTDTTLAANSDARIPSQKAVRAYVAAHSGGGPAAESPFYFAEDYGAVGDGVTEDQDAIQSAIDDAYAAGGGIVLLDNVTYGIGVTSDPADAGTTATGGTAHLGLVLKDNVQLVGMGRATTLKRIVLDPLVMVDFYRCRGAQVRNLRVDGNMTTYAVSGATYGSGSGLFVESSSGTEDRDNIIDTVWIEDTGGYGIGVEWGHHRGLTIRNIFIDGTWSDGIDIKRMNSGTFDAYAIVLDNIHIQNFGQGATDDLQTGVDIRGFVTASNIHVRKYGSKASCGIRMRGGITADTVIGAQKSSVTNFHIEYDGTGGTSTVRGLEYNPDDVQASNGNITGCQYNVIATLSGAATAAARMSLTNIKSFAATTAGFTVASEISDVDFYGCMDSGSPIGFYIAGDRCRLFGPVYDGTGTGISVQSTADGTQIYGPSFTGTPSANVSDSGTNTLLIGSPDNTSDKLPGRLTVGARILRDTNYYLDLSSSNPVVNFDNLDQILYDRTNNVFAFVIANTHRAWMNGVALQPAANDGLALGTGSNGWADLFLATGGVINWANGGITLTEASDILLHAGAQSYKFDAAILPTTSDGAALGSTSLMFSDLFLASGGVINWNNGDVTATHSSNKLDFAGAASGYTFDNKLAIGTSTFFTGAAGGVPGVCISGLVGTVNGYFANDSNPVIIESVKSRNTTVGSHTIVQSGDAIAEWRVEGSDGTQFIRLGQMRWSMDGTPGTSDMPGRMGIFTTPSGSSTPIERLRVNSAGSVITNASGSALATNATAGFTYIPSCAGAPSGTPTAVTGAVPLVYDSTNNNFYVYNGGWKKVLLS